METTSLISIFPVEILQQIFKLMPTKQLVRCRVVCMRWKEIIDDLTGEEFWCKRLMLDYKKTYRQARSKSKCCLSWRDLYVSLSLWPKLMSANDDWREIEPSNSAQFDSLHAWKGNVAGHVRNCVIYYDSQTLQQTNKIVVGDYMTFDENDDVIVYLYYTHPDMAWYKELRIVPKGKNTLLFEKMTKDDQVNNFKIFHDKIYYNKWQQDPLQSFNIITEMYQYNLKDLKRSRICPLNESVWVFGSTEDSLHFLTSNEKIYSLVGDGFEFTSHVNEDNNYTCFYTLCKYNLTGGGDMTDSIMDKATITKRFAYIPETVFIYGDVVFIGDKKGSLRIYYRPNMDTEQTTQPLKVYDIKPLLDMSKENKGMRIIKAIDVMEKEYGHIVIIATKNKILVLDLTHKVQ